MKKTISLFVVFLFFAGSAFGGSRDLHHVARELDHLSDSLLSNYKSYLQGNRRWKPRGDERYLFDAICDYERRIDHLRSDIENRRGPHRVSQQAQLALRAGGEVDRFMRYNHCGRTASVWRRNLRALDSLEDHVSGRRHSRRGRYYDERERFDRRRGYSRWDDYGYDRYEDDYYRDRRPHRGRVIYRIY